MFALSINLYTSLHPHLQRRRIDQCIVIMVHTSGSDLGIYHHYNALNQLFELAIQEI